MLEQLAQIIGDLALTEGNTPTAVDGLSAYRMSHPSPVQCLVYHPCVIIVAQGAKRASIGGLDFDYSPARYLVLPVSLPIGAQVVEASPERPFLSMALQVDAVMLGELVSTIDRGRPRPLPAVRGIAVSETTDEILDAALRLLSCLDSEADCRVLAPQIQREILYRILLGPQGDLLRGAGRRDARLGQISLALNLIHGHFDRHIDVAELANEAHMSPSTFYDAFKSVTSYSPLQYLKEIRLTRARQLLVWEGSTANRAARQVGYSSASQFSREFKRRFGRPPGEERAWAVAAGELQAVRPY